MDLSTSRTRLVLHPAPLELLQHVRRPLALLTIIKTPVAEGKIYATNTGSAAVSAATQLPTDAAYVACIRRSFSRIQCAADRSDDAGLTQNHPRSEWLRQRDATNNSDGLRFGEGGRTCCLRRVPEPANRFAAKVARHPQSEWLRQRDATNNSDGLRFGEGARTCCLRRVPEPANRFAAKKMNKTLFAPNS